MKTELCRNTKEGRLADQSRERQAAFKKKKKTYERNRSEDIKENESEKQKNNGNHLWSLQSDWSSATWMFSFSKIAQFFLALNYHCSKSRHACSVKNRIISALYRLVSVSDTMWRRQLFASAFQKTGFLIDKIFRVLTEICDFKMAVISGHWTHVCGNFGRPIQNHACAYSK